MSYRNVCACSPDPERSYRTGATPCLFTNCLSSTNPGCMLSYVLVSPYGDQVTSTQADSSDVEPSATTSPSDSTSALNIPGTGWFF